jgi:hypothetical protein
MKKVILLLVITAVAIFAGVLFFLHSGGASDAASLAPADSVFFLNIPNTPLSALRWQDTALAKIGREPEVKAFLEMPLKNLFSSPGGDEATKILIALKPSNLFTAITCDPTDKTQALIGFQFWGKKTDFENAVARFRQEVSGGNAPTPTIENYKNAEILATTHGEFTIYSTSVGRWGFLASNSRVLKEAVDRAHGEKPTTPALKENPRYTKVVSHLFWEPDLFMFLQPENAIDSLLQVGKTFGVTSIHSQVQALKSNQAIGCALKFDADLQRDAIFILRPSEAKSVPHLAHTSMPLTNAETPFFFDFLVDMVKLPESLAGFLEDYPAMKPLVSAIASSYGPECSLFADWQSGRMIPSPLATISVRDAEQAKKIFDSAVSQIPGANAQTVNTVPIYSIPTPYMTICLAQNEKFLLLGSDENAVATAASKKSGGPTLADSEYFQSALSTYKSSNEAFCYIDSRLVFDRLYSAFVPVLRFGAAMMPGMNRTFDLSKLPKSETITRHLPPISMSQKRLDDGILLESSGPLSMGQFVVLCTSLWFGLQKPNH